MTNENLDLDCCNSSHSLHNNTKLTDEMIYEISDFFKVFGDSTRIKILHALLQSELCVCEISSLLNVSQSAVSHQLRVLRQNKIVKFRKIGKTVYYSLDDSHVATVLSQGIEHVSHNK